MRRSIDEALRALRVHVDAWAEGRSSDALRVFVYPPEWEAVMLERLPTFAASCADAGRPVTLVDIGQSFLAELERRPGFIDQLQRIEREDEAQAMSDLGTIAGRLVARVLQMPAAPPAVCQIIMNTGALGPFVSYSAIANDQFGSEAARSVIAFPGEDDQRSLNLLRLRPDSSYRIPRI